MADGSHRARFGPFEIDLGTGELTREGIPVALAPQPTKVLRLLVERSGRLVTRDELRDLLWPDTVVEFDHGLNTCVRQIREALGEKADDPVHVQTVPRRGYRFIAPLRTDEPDGEVDPPETPPGRSPLRRLSPAAVAMLVAALGIVWLAWPEKDRRVAILPFENLSPASLPPAFVDGLSEEIVVELSRHDPDDLSVIARASVAEQAHRRSTRKIAAALGATHLVTGTVRATGAGVELTVSLVRADDGAAVWTARFRDPELDPLSAMAPLAQRIAVAMSAELVRGPAVARSSADREAGEALLKGRYLLARGRSADALRHLERAIDRDPGFALAHAILARARLGAGDAAGAAAAAERALALAPGLPEAHQARADVAARSRRDWGGALRGYRAAIDLEPGSAELRQGRAWVLTLLGRHEEAIGEIERALSLDPVSPLVNGDVAWLHVYARRFPEAVEQARATVDLAPDHASAWYCLVVALEAAGDRAAARDTAADVAARYGAPADVVAAIRAAAPADGIDRFWRWDLDQMWENELAERYPLDFAAAYARFGDPGRALDFIERGIEAGANIAPVIAVDPRFDPLRGQPRFDRALARLNLPAGVHGS